MSKWIALLPAVAAAALAFRFRQPRRIRQKLLGVSTS
jgi:hypothetical protein